MKIAFLQNLWHEYVGIVYMASLLKKHGHSCEVFIEGGEKDLIKSILKYNPDIIGFPCTTGSHQWGMSLAKKLKKKLNFVCVFGGPHPTFFPEIINDPNVDIVSIGESEYAFLELVEALEKKEKITNIKNLWVKKNGKIYKNEVRPLIQDLDELPFPDRALYYKYSFLADNETKTFISGRGCPYQCTFCFNHTYMNMYSGKGKYVRKRSVDNVIKEILSVKAKYRLKTLFFADDTFIIDKKWLKEFCMRYRKEVGLGFFCGARADLVDEETVKMLKYAGCYMVTIGIESGNEYIRNQVYKKGVSNEQIIKAGRLFKKYGIKTRSTNIFCAPDENISRVWETIKINIVAKINYPFSSLFQPYPKTKITEYAYEKGYLDSNFNYNKLSALYFKDSVMNIKDKKEICNLHRFFYFAVKWPWTHPLINILIKFPTTFIYDWIFYIGFAHNYARYKRMGLFKVIKLGIKTLKNKVKV